MVMDIGVRWSPFFMLFLKFVNISGEFTNLKVVGDWDKHPKKILVNSSESWWIIPNSGQESKTPQTWNHQGAKPISWDVEDSLDKLQEKNCQHCQARLNAINWCVFISYYLNLSQTMERTCFAQLASRSALNCCSICSICILSFSISFILSFWICSRGLSSQQKPPFLVDKPWYSSVPTKMAGFAGCPSPHSFQWHFLGNLTHTHLAKSGQVTSLFGHDSPYQSPGTTTPDWMDETVQSGVQTNHVHCCRGSWGLIYIYI